MWQAWLAGGGASSLVVSLAWIAYRLHSDAVRAEQRRADDWKAAAEAASKRADVRDEQMATLLGRREPAP